MTLTFGYAHVRDNKDVILAESGVFSDNPWLANRLARETQKLEKFVIKQADNGQIIILTKDYEIKVIPWFCVAQPFLRMT